MDRLEADLTTFYDWEAAARATRALAPERVTRRAEFTALLQAEGRGTILEVGTGPGHDAAAFVEAGLAVSGVDLSAEHVRMARQVGVDAHQASVHAMPFPPRAFDAGWTMSTLLHVPDNQFDAALQAIAARLVPDAPLAVGLWGGFDREALHSDDPEPRRFFSHRSDQRLRRMLASVGAVERFETWVHPQAEPMHYQWALIRIRPAGAAD